MKILGISCYFHDSAAALVVDGRAVAAAAEERFTLRKHDPEFPHQAVGACLDKAGLLASDLDGVVFYEKPLRKFDRILSSQLCTFPRSLPAFLQAMPPWLNRKLQVGKLISEALFVGSPVWFADHHCSHAAASFYTSPFERSAILVADGVGEWSTTSLGVADEDGLRLEKEIRFPHSLGLFYSALADYLGFRVNNDEWKVMALGALGEPVYLPRLRRLLSPLEDGSFQFDMRYFDHHRNPARLFSKRVEKLLGFGPRPKGRDNSKIAQRYCDLVCSGQRLLEEVLLSMLRYLHRRYQTPNLCLGGGVALNCVANGKLLAQGPFRNIHVPPAPGDDGAALGAALLASRLRSPDQDRQSNSSPYLGCEYSDREAIRPLTDKGLAVEILQEDELYSRAAQSLRRGFVIGWFQGAMEFGPRALGNRSILASPLDRGLRERINHSIKGRESFRPLAPAVMAQFASNYFDFGGSSPFMSFAARVHRSKAREVPAVLHVDGSARLQTVDGGQNPRFYKLLREFKARTGVPLLLNTSLNVAGQPIARTPADALATGREGGLDELFIGRVRVSLRDQQRQPAQERLQQCTGGG